MPENRLSLALPRGEFCDKVKSVLLHAGYTVNDTLSSGMEALRRFRMSPPDIAIVNFELPDMNGLDLAKVLCEEAICKVILLAPKPRKEDCEKAAGKLDLFVLEKPLHRQVLLNAVDTMNQYDQKIKHLEEELEELKESMKARILIDRAKGIIMNQGVEENTAYTAMRKVSMDRRVPLREIAQMIIEGRLSWNDIRH